MDKFREECGVFGIFGHPEASNLTYLGLYALQHRGQESAGIAASDGNVIRHRKAMGYVNEAFDAEALAKLPGSLAVGHVRYSTAGESRVLNAQPIVGESVNEVRTDLGRRLAVESPVDADVVVPIPDSGVCAAVGYAEASGIPMRMGLIRNHYVGRTFIQPQQSIRHFGVRVKLNPVRSILDGQRVVLVDDSLVRGTTSRKIVKMMKAAGAKQVHMRISCPPTISPCFYGIDTPRR